MSDSRKLSQPSPSNQIQSFLEQVAKTPAIAPNAGKGRLLFALDATASREPTWQEARRLQADMFDVAASSGGLAIQLCYYRGLADFFATPWLTQSRDLKARMERVECLGGLTQIRRVLEHAVHEARRERVNAMVFIGDCVEEDADTLTHLAGQLGVLNTRVFLFQEGDDPTAERIFRQIAKLSGGAHCHFDAGSARQLGDLLGAVAAYAAGGQAALETYGRIRGGLALQLTHQIPKR
jgi:hypothetical protein